MTWTKLRVILKEGMVKTSSYVYFLYPCLQNLALYFAIHVMHTAHLIYVYDEKRIVIRVVYQFHDLKWQDQRFIGPNVKETRRIVEVLVL